jgi:hypothetical protein
LPWADRVVVPESEAATAWSGLSTEAAWTAGVLAGARTHVLAWTAGVLAGARTHALAGARTHVLAGARSKAATEPTFEIARAVFRARPRAGVGSSPSLRWPSRPRIGGLPSAPEGPRSFSATIDRAVVAAFRSRFLRSKPAGARTGPVSTRTCAARS